VVLELQDKVMTVAHRIQLVEVEVEEREQLALQAANPTQTLEAMAEQV
jgi:hypothetical protein